MNVLIIEDEIVASRQLTRLLIETRAEIKIVSVLDTVRQAVQWLQANTEPDLIISDIQLADGLCFDIFKEVNTSCPVIFTTAYDEYMQEAFKLHSIDYLLKPINTQDLTVALAKYDRMVKHYSGEFYEKLSKIINAAAPARNYKTRFLLKTGDRLSTLAVDQVAYVSAENRYVFLYDKKGKKFLIDDPLDDLEKTLDPAVFFRLNRQYITPVDSIEKIETHFNGKLHISLRHCPDTGIFVSREKAKAFKKWLEGESQQ